MPKRPRESGGIDVALVEVWEDLAHEHEDIRLKAAHKLLTNHVPNSEHDTLITILRRLFRGLCSGRKAARLGFSIALTETLSYVKANKSSVSISEIIDILEQHTVPDANTTGQDERDHYFGRLFGCEAIIKSQLLFEKSELKRWQRLLDVICGLAIKKSWLRQECGWVLFNCVRGSLLEAKLGDFAINILEKLIEHQLIRTPEGLAIWLGIRSAFPITQLPKKIWKHDDPLAAKEAQTLAKVLKDAKSNSKDEGENEVQGSANWSAQLHFAWDVVLLELLRSGENTKRITLHEFWKASVEDGLFASSNSTERKHWGFLMLQKALTTDSSDIIAACITKNAVNCLMQSLKGNNRYLQRSAQKTLQAIQARAEARKGDVSLIVAAFLVASAMTDFDTFTKTKFFESLFNSCDPEECEDIAINLTKFLDDPDTADASEAILRRKNITGIQFKLFSIVVAKAVANPSKIDLTSLQQILNGWILRISKTTKENSLPLAKATETFISERCSLAFEQALKLGSQGRSLVLKSVAQLQKNASMDLHFPGAEQSITETILRGWKRFREAQKKAYPSNGVQALEGKHGSQATPTLEGVALLYGLTLFQIYQDDADAISVLGDLLDFEQHRGDSPTHSSQSNADGLLEIILSFVSRPSKFLRRVSLDIFAAFTSQITPQGLQSLIDILETNEGRSGQLELFQVDGVAENAGSDGQSTSDVDMLDSDVEEVSVEEASSSDGDESGDSGESDDESTGSSSKSASVNGDTGENVDELVKLETSLAAALGTRKVTQADLDATNSSSDSDSDADMTDSEMMALDEKLADVFRARQANSNQKNQQKAAKGNIVNFKNRVLDMIDIYFKTEVYQKQESNPDSLRFVLPLLNLARSTKTKYLGDHALDLIKTFCGKCKGLQNVPRLLAAKPASKSRGQKSKSKKSRKGSDEDTDDEVVEVEPAAEATIDWALNLMTSIHDEAGTANTSNAHKAACSQTSLLLVKVLLKAGSGIETIVGVYAATRLRMLTDSSYQVQERLFTEWGTWCGTVAGRLGENLGAAGKTA